MALGPELVKHGTFDSADDWIPQLPWTIGGGVASITSAAGGVNKSITQLGLSVSAGKRYRLSIGITVSNGCTISAAVGGGAGQIIFQFIATSQTKVVDFILADGADTGLVILAYDTTGAADATIDNVSLKEILGGASAATTMFFDEE